MRSRPVLRHYAINALHASLCALLFVGLAVAFGNPAAARPAPPVLREALVSFVPGSKYPFKSPRGLVRGRRAECPFNFAAMDTLCTTATAPSASAQIGSGNGIFAFLFEDGYPKIYSFSAWGGWKTRWTLPVSQRAPACSSAEALFDKSGDIIFRCNGTNKAVLSVGIGGIRPKTVSIDNYGLVKFVGPNKEVILSIHPEEGPKPPSALRMYPWGKTPTSQTSKPSGVPKPPPAIKMASLALDKRNQILNPRCKYVSVPFAANKNPKSTFNIELVGCGTTSAMDDVFVRAAQTWMNIISGDVTAFEAGKGGPQACLTDSQEKPVLSCGYIDDIIVGYSVEPEDGNAKAVAWGTPLDMRSASSKHRNLPYSGWMQIDSADYDQLVADGLLYSVILHEMGHVLGFGTVWSDMNLLRPRNCADLIRQKKKVSNPRFFGSAASKMLTKVKYTAGGRPPVDGDGDQGTACFHWADDRFNGELMTGYVSAEPLISVITVASLQDIGYQVDLNSPLITPFDASGRPFNRLPGAKLSPVIKMGTCLDNPTRNRVRHERSLQAE